MKNAKKILVLLLCAVLLVGASVAGTLAYLTSQATVTNSFTVGKVVLGGDAQAGLDEAKVDELLEAGRYEPDSEKRLAIYAELQAYLAEKAYDLPMWEDVNINAYQSNVKGFVNDANKFYHFNTVYFE